MGMNSFIESNQKTISELYNKLLLTKKRKRKDCRPEGALTEDPVSYIANMLQTNRQALAKKNVVYNFNVKLDAVLDSKLKNTNAKNPVEPLKLLFNNDRDLEHPSGARTARALSFCNANPISASTLLEAEVKSLQSKFEKERQMRRELEKTNRKTYQKIGETD